MRKVVVVFDSLLFHLFAYLYLYCYYHSKSYLKFVFDFEFVFKFLECSNFQISRKDCSDKMFAFSFFLYLRKNVLVFDSGYYYVLLYYVLSVWFICLTLYTQKRWYTCCTIIICRNSLTSLPKLFFVRIFILKPVK